MSDIQLYFVIPNQRYSVGEKIRKIADLINRLQKDEMANRLEFL